MKHNVEEIRQLAITDIARKIEALEKEFYNLRYKAQASQANKPHRFKELRKEIARCKTIIKEKGLTDAGKQPK